jgi:hypothetical protein
LDLLAIEKMDATLTYALLAGVALVILAVIVKAALRWAFKIIAVLLVLAALAVGTWLWFNSSNRQQQHDRTATPTRRATPAQH